MPDMNYQEILGGRETAFWNRNAEWDYKVRQHWNIWSCSKCGYIRTKGWENTSEGRKPKANFCECCGRRIQ